ncbi:MAG: hypothetical protein ACFFBD_09640 [Candidatus Hodarchaeota archaeon]
MVYSDESCESLEYTPINTDVVGRPAWWFKGSFFVPNSPHQRRLAVLHQQTLAKTEEVLSSKAKTLHRMISTLSNWFPINILDQIAKHLLLQEQSLPANSALLTLILGYLESLLRQKQLTIQWPVLKEINEVFDTNLKKSDYAKYVFLARRDLGLPPFDNYAIVKRIVVTKIAARASLPAETKKTALKQTVKIMNYLKEKRFIFKDAEIMAAAVTRFVLNEKGSINVPSPQKKMVSRLIYRIRQDLEESMITDCS